MIFFIGLLTAALILNCLVLVLLVLIQLPKKDAGAGMAFGGAAADALFGAGSGNALTKITKYATIAFFVLTVFIGYLQTHYSHPTGSQFQKEVEQHQSTPMTAPSSSAPGVAAPAMTPASTNALLAVPLTTVPTGSNTAPAPAPQK